MHDAIRRRVLMLAASGALGASGLSGFMSRALASGDLPKTSGIHRLEGSATVNGTAARVGTPVQPGDRIETGRASQAVVVIGKDAFLVREMTVIETRGSDNGLKELLISTGRVLSVFAKKPVSIKVPVANIGIRGTGAYLEVEPQGVYFCLCYGEAVVEGAGMPAKVVKTTHHEQPMVIHAEGGVTTADPAKFRNHTDDELILLESLVGREPPFMKDGRYPANRY
ncbi:MAG TPA: hypothetical protein VFP44_03035 [Usitatibacter sp.]|nr:hypothetical protein [Usitatibacter sp.]